MRVFLFVSFVMALGLYGSYADALKNIPPPVAPFVVPVAENLDWTITVKYPAPEESPAGEVLPPRDASIVEVHSTKTGSLKRDLIKRTKGPVKEVWFADAFLLWTNAQGDVSISDLSGAPERAPDDDNPSVPSGFPGMGWPKLENYKGAVTYEERRCYHYTAEKAEAWVEIETMLPVAYQTENGLFLYKFNAPPKNKLEPPPAYKHALDLVQEKLEKRRQLQKDLQGQ